jgi:hypothetical protein
MDRKVILSVMTGLLAVAISTGVAPAAQAVKDAQRFNAAKDLVSSDSDQKQRDAVRFNVTKGSSQGLVSSDSNQKRLPVRDADTLRFNAIEGDLSGRTMPAK